MSRSKYYFWIAILLLAIASLTFFSFKLIQKYMSDTEDTYPDPENTSNEISQVYYGKMSDEGEILHISKPNEYGIMLQVRIQPKDAVSAYDFLFTKEMLDYLKVFNQQGAELSYDHLRVGQEISITKNLIESSSYVQYVFQITKDSDQ